MTRGSRALCAILALGGAHGAVAATAPVVGYPGSSPPLTGVPGRGEAAAATLATWAQLPAVVMGSPHAWSRALEYVRVSRVLGREAEARVVLLALARKVPTRWPRTALEELLPVDAGETRDPPPARSRAELRLHVQVHAAMAAILTGDLGDALAPVGRVAGLLEETDGRRLAPPTRLALIRLFAVLDPARARRRAWATWVWASRSRHRGVGAEALGLLGAMGGPQRRPLLMRALAGAQRSAGARETFPWLAQAADLGLTVAPQGGACVALSGDVAAYRFDCELLRFEAAWRRGSWSDAFAAYSALDRRLEPSLPVAQRLRAASTVLPFLKAIEEWHGFQRWHSVATAAASVIRDPRLVGRLAVELAAGLRVAGRPDAARRVLDDVDTRSSDELQVRTLVEKARLATDGGSMGEGQRLLDDALTLARGTSARARAAALLAAMDLAPAALSASDARWLARAMPPESIPVGLWRALIQGRLAESERRWDASAEQYAAAWDLLADSDESGVETAIGRFVLRRRLAERRAAVELAARRPRPALSALEAARSRRRTHVGRWQHLAAHVTAEDLVLAFGRVDRELWVWRVGADRVAAMRLAEDASEILELARLWTRAVVHEAAPDSWERVGRRLADRLLAPIVRAGWTQGKSRLLVSSATGLEGVAVDVLARMTRGGASAVRRGAVSTASLAALDDSWHRHRPAGGAVAFLPRTGVASLAEARFVASRTGARMFLGGDATKARFRSASQGASVIHFGGHSEAPGPLLDSGGLTLRPLDLPAGVLRYREIAALRLEGATVVLLGCDTAAAGSSRGAASPLAGVSSLTEAFFQAGTRAVIGSLWAIDDPAARDIAREFYAAGGPEAGPVALALTKRRLQAEYPRRPARWAGLVWQGAPPDRGAPPGPS